MPSFLLLEMELKYVRPREIERKLELARYVREAEECRPGLRERLLLLVSDLLISIGQGLKERYVPFDGCGSAAQSVESIPSGS
jgi:hypothetical protein